MSIKRNTKVAKDCDKLELVIDQNCVAFWTPEKQNGYFSQWYKSYFELDDDEYSRLPEQITSLAVVKEKPDVIEKLKNIQFRCAEQFMMLAKAYLFGDDEIATLIIAESDPKVHKKLGRRIKDFDGQIWDRFCDSIVVLGSYLKFSQNSDLKDALLESGNAELIEGSPVDRIWGVGLRYDSPHIFNKSKWRGQNKLGFALMKVRNILNKTV